MSEGFLTGTVIKVVDELSKKLYVPATIIAVCVDYLPILKENLKLDNFWILYIICFIIGVSISFGAFIFLVLADSYTPLWLEDIDIYKIIGIFLIPLGVISLFPDFFPLLDTKMSQATGGASIIWGFMLLGRSRYA